VTRQDKSRLFRKEALERLDDIDELDHLVTVTHPRAWLALSAVAALILVALTWASFGKLDTTVAGEGILLAGGHTMRVAALQEGRLAKLLVDVGDRVTQGQAVALVAPVDQMRALQQAEARVDLARQEHDALTATNDAPAQDVAAAQDALEQAEQALERAVTAAAGDTVTSPYAGVVGSLQAYPGQYMAPGAPLITVEPKDVPLVASLYLPLDDGKKVEKGQEVQIVPSTQNVEEYGYMLGRVTFVADLASTPESMNAVLQNEFLVREFSAAGPVLRVEAALIPDPDTPSGYAWSSSDGPPGEIGGGMTCSARVVISSAAPITYAFPALGRLVGGAE